MPESKPQGSDAVRFPECDERLEGNLERVPASIGEDSVRVAIDCTACAEQLEVVARALSTWRVIGQNDENE